jgi:hypothetical protein
MERGAAPAGMRSSRRLPGGLGTPLYGHYDPCARSSLNGLPPVRGRYANAVRGSCGLACAAHARRRKKARRAQSRQVMRREAAGFAGTRRIRNALRLSAHHSPHLAHVGFTRYAPLQVSRRRRTRRRKQYGRRSFARARRSLADANLAEPNFAPRVISRMATKPIPPEVQAERAQAAADYRNAHQGAIDRIAILRAARMKRDAEQAKAKRRKN